MNTLLRISRAIDECGRWLSRIAVWLVLVAALLSACNAFFRYFINEIIDLAQALQAAWRVAGGCSTGTATTPTRFSKRNGTCSRVMAMFGAAYTLKVNEHVRVDLIYGTVSERTRTWIDLFGGIFCLVPMCLV